ncbi:MAG TPA: MFS transporter [Candidatus Limnocylindria bacterium]|nr:MFS transporter [Candidatus Limnocylindria bacterium]
MPPATESQPPTRLSVARQLFLSCYWLAYNLQWGALLAIVLPSQIAAIVGDARKEFYSGLVLGIGAALSLIVTPIVGGLSDRSRSRFGRRGPYLLVGTLVNVLFLAWLARFGAGSNVWMFVLVYLGVQLGSNWAGGPYAGLIPDLVPREQRGSASGWLALMTAIGTLVGAIAAGQLVRAGHYGSAYALIAVALVAMMALTLLGVRERPATGAPRVDWRRLIHDFLPTWRQHRDFYWVLITRALVTMGIYSVFTFFQYFLKDIVAVERPEEQASFLIGIIIATGIPTSLVSGSLSDRYGRKPLVYLSGGLMALASLVFIAVALAPSLWFVFAVGALFGVGYGAYQAVDWALAVDVLPAGENAAKDMGIWHVALVLPQVLAPLITGIVLASLKDISLLTGYTVVFIVTALWFVLGTVFVRQVRGAR